MRALICSVVVVWIIISGGIAKGESPEACHNICESLKKIVWESYVSASKGAKVAKTRSKMIRNNQKIDEDLVTSAVNKGFELFYMNGNQFIKNKSASIADIKKGCYLGCVNSEDYFGTEEPETETSEAIIDQNSGPLSKGRVLITKKANSYTFAQIEVNGEPVWISYLGDYIKVGDMVEYRNTPPMINFESKFLKMTFDKVIFTPEIKVIQ